MQRKRFIPLFTIAALGSVSLGFTSEAFAKSFIDRSNSSGSSAELIACGGGGGGIKKREAKKKAQEELKRLFEEKQKEKEGSDK